MEWIEYTIVDENGEEWVSHDNMADAQREADSMNEGKPKEGKSWFKVIACECSDRDLNAHE